MSITNLAVPRSGQEGFISARLALLRVPGRTGGGQSAWPLGTGLPFRTIIIL
jgi:hypothetical protein